MDVSITDISTRYSCSEGQNLEIVGGRAELLEKNTHRFASDPV